MMQKNIKNIYELFESELPVFLNFVGIKRNIERSEGDRFLGEKERQIFTAYFLRIEVKGEENFPGFSALEFGKNNWRKKIYDLMIPLIRKKEVPRILLQIIEPYQDSLNRFLKENPNINLSSQDEIDEFIERRNQNNMNRLLKENPNIDLPRYEIDEFIIMSLRDINWIKRDEKKNIIDSITIKIIERLLEDCKKIIYYFNKRPEYYRNKYPELITIYKKFTKISSTAEKNKQKPKSLNDKKVKLIWNNYFMKPNGDINQKKLGPILAELNLLKIFDNNIKKTINYVKEEMRKLELFPITKIDKMKSLEQRYHDEESDYNLPKSDSLKIKHLERRLTQLNDIL